MDDFFQDFPHFRAVALDVAFGAFDIAGVAMLFQAGNHERAVEFQRHGLWQAALIQFEMRSDHNYRPARIIDTLAQQVAAEAPLLALEHIAQRL